MLKLSIVIAISLNKTLTVEGALEETIRISKINKDKLKEIIQTSNSMI